MSERAVILLFLCVLIYALGLTYYCFVGGGM